MNATTTEKLENANYFVCSNGGEPDCIKFTWPNARKTNAEYIDAFGYTGKKEASVKWIAKDTYTDEF